MRSPLIHRWLHALAFAAMALMIVAPMISRALASPNGVTIQTLTARAEHPLAMEPTTVHHMHHDMDHSVVMTPDAMDATSTAAKPATSVNPHAEHEMGVDCEYCLIAARMISLLVAILLLRATWPATLHALSGLVETRRSPARGTLGARGPP